MNDLHPNFRLWIYSESREGVFGDGKARLLKEIARTGSLREAAGSLGISYRKAWGDLKKAESCLRLRLIERTRGGKGGGGTTLTQHGRKVLKAFERFRELTRVHIHESFGRLQEEIHS